MWRQFLDWHARLPYPDALERRNAALLETMELSVAGAALLMLPVLLLSERAFAATLVVNGLLLLCMAIALVAVALVRSGRLQGSALLTAGMLIAVLSVLLFGNTLAEGAEIMFAYALPLTIGGLLAGRRGIVLTCVASMLGVGLALLLVALGAPGAGFAVSSKDSTLMSFVTFGILTSLLGLFMDILSTQAREALAARRSRERELEGLSRKLELAVRERSADLEIALGALEQRAAEAERLLDENSRQRGAIRALSVPVLPLDGRTLVMPLVGELDGSRLEAVQTQALEAVERTAARRLLIDITGVPLIDTYVAQSLLRTLSAARLLGAEVVLVGVRPEVAQTIVGLGIDVGELRTYADLQTALR